METPCEIVAWCEDRHVALVIMRAITADTGTPHTVTMAVDGVRWEIRRLRRLVDPYYYVQETCGGNA